MSCPAGIPNKRQRISQASIRGMCSTAGTSGAELVCRRHLGLNSKGIFAPAAVFGEDRAQMPLSVELGSGSGEWAVARALADADRSNWLTVEATLNLTLTNVKHTQ